VTYFHCVCGEVVASDQPHQCPRDTIDFSDLVDWRTRAERAEARVKELEADLERFRHPACGACGTEMDGQWFDGCEIQCPACRVDVVATLMEDGSWTFPTAYDEDEPDPATPGDGADQ
jgi:hypothetical protein